MNHLEFAKLESDMLEETSWDKWIARAEKMAGFCLDGNQSKDGYSIDYAYDAFKEGRSVVDYLEGVLAEIRTRLDSILGNLNAHRQGWITWTKEDLAEMRAERAEVNKKLQSLEYGIGNYKLAEEGRF